MVKLSAGQQRTLKEICDAYAQRYTLEWGVIDSRWRRDTLRVLERTGHIEIRTFVVESVTLRRGAYGRLLTGAKAHADVTLEVRPAHSKG